MAHAQKPDFIFRRKGRVHLNREGRQFSRLLAAEVCAFALVMLHTQCSEGFWEYWLPTPLASFPLISPHVRHRVPSGFNRSLPLVTTLLQGFNPNSHQQQEHLVTKEQVPTPPTADLSCEYPTVHKPTLYQMALWCPLFRHFYHHSLSPLAGAEQKVNAKTGSWWMTLLTVTGPSTIFHPPGNIKKTEFTFFLWPEWKCCLRIKFLQLMFPWFRHTFRLSFAEKLIQNKTRFISQQAAPGTSASESWIFWEFICVWLYYVSRDSSVSIATRYGLDGPGIESR